MSGTLLSNELGRLKALGATPASDDTIPMRDTSTGKIFSVTVNEIATGARAVDGPASSTDNAIARFDGTSGILIQDSSVLIDNSDNMTGVVAVTATGAITTTSAKTDYDKFLGIDSLILATVGTFTITRESKGLVVSRKSAADDTSVLMIDITEELRTTASKGLQLDTMDVIFSNGTADLDAHSATLSRITYADSTTEVVTDMPITGTLGVGQDADPQVDRLTVTTPAFEVTALTKVVLEITVDAAATSAYDYIGTVLNFTRNDL